MMLPIGVAPQRLAVALGVSVLFHAWLMQSYYGKGAARGGAGETVIVARILPAASPSPSYDRAVEPPSTLVVPSNMVAVPITDASAIPAALTANVTTTAAALPQPSDPTYYAVGDLDVFPKALVKPDLNAVLAADHEPAAGKVRATLLIDEAGVVNAVRAIDAPSGDIAAITRELLVRTLFTPARNKDGRIVKAEVRVALDYDLRATPRVQK